MKKLYIFLILSFLFSCSDDDMTSDGNLTGFSNTQIIKGINFITQQVVDQRSEQVNTDINHKNEFIYIGRTNTANLFILQIGKVNTTNGAVSFGNVNNINYDYGSPPSVSLNDWGKAVEVHKSNSTSNYYYRGGKITSENPLFFQFDKDNHKFDTGNSNPSIDITDGKPNFYISTVHSSHGKIYSRSATYKMNGNNETYTWEDSMPVYEGNNPRVSINNNFQAAMVFEKNDGNVYIAVGIFGLNGTIVWEKPSSFGKGTEADVHISDNGDVFCVYQNNKKIITRTGLIQNFKSVEWSSTQYTNYIGTNPSISSNKEVVILTYNGSTGVNWFHVGKFNY
ncbi:hypothetical protein [Aureivirga sp. CE67]|uniref:hypothetical protein n=1 Tax=Aureivirga sp. CE67 TaxID=1788983 RepID=UPI0018C8D82F|nr:hypothetical protein [Aureivirga sp. CE67]